MYRHVADLEGRPAWWWVGFALALFLLVPVDFLTTLLAVGQHGLAVEANPFVRWLLGYGLVPATLVQLLVVGLAVAMFDAALRLVDAAPAHEHPRRARIVDVWVVVMLVAAVALLANNVVALV